MLLPVSQPVKSNNGSILQHSLQGSGDPFGALDSKLKPHSILPLFDGGEFDAEYNTRYKPVEFKTPDGIKKAVLEAVVTGMLHMVLPTSQWVSIISHHGSAMTAGNMCSTGLAYVSMSHLHCVQCIRRQLQILTHMPEVKVACGVSQVLAVHVELV